MAVEINGDGLITVDGTTSTQGRVRLKEDADNGTNYVELTAPASVTANRTITFPDDTGTVLTNSGNQTGVFSALTVNSNNISADNSLGFRNRIINGAMVIDQRNAGASFTPGDGNYTIDRWAFFVSQSSKLTTQQSSVAPAGFTNSLLVTSSSAYSSGANDYFVVQQTIEGYNVADMGFGATGAATFTLSFWVRSSLTGTFGGSAKNLATNATRSYPFTYTINSANTWEQKTVTIAGDTTGTWNKTTGSGLCIDFNLGTGTTYSGTAGAWAGTNYLSTTGSTSVVGTNGATWYITGVQLEVGSVATPFERRPYGTELMLCQRYFETSFKAGTAPANNVSNNFGGIGTQYTTVDLVTQNMQFKATKRTDPTMTYYSSNQKASPTADQWQYYNGSAWVDATLTQNNRVTDNSFTVYFRTSGFNADSSVMFFGGWAASAEL